MTMSRTIFNRVTLLVIALLFSSVCLNSQTYSSFAPYSYYGIGDLMTQGTAYNKTMGGVGIANRTNRFINPLNPASVTARDSLSFMADFSVYCDNKYFRQGDIKSVSNLFNINDLILSFPIWKSSAMMVGIVPYSGTGYAYSYNYLDPSVIGQTGKISYSATGQGAVYQAFAAVGVTFFKRLSLGFQYNLNFGQTSKKYYETFTETSFNGAENGFDIEICASAFKFGLQYEQPLGAGSSITVGGTYNLNLKSGGQVTGYKFSTGTAVTDTLTYKTIDLKEEGNIKFADEIGAGICLKINDRFMFEFDYSYADWRNCGFDETMGFKGNTVTTSELSSFKSSVSNVFRFGMEYVPNRNDIRYYYKKCAYRVGAYYKNDYFRMDGNNIDSFGITLGATIPVFRWYNGMSFAVELGQRGSLKDNLIRERYVNFTVGISIFDIWFQRLRYE